jgi:acyl-CoA reductase-like NAD-dependent aldehyde dehydrogenase
MKTNTKHYIDGAFVESHGREVMDSINPSNGKMIGRVMLGDAFQILAGRVAINRLLEDPQAHWGGFKHSGVGREFGTFGIEAFLESRAILE